MVCFAQREAYETGRIAEPMLNFFLAGTGAKHNIFVDFWLSQTRLRNSGNSNSGNIKSCKLHLECSAKKEKIMLEALDFCIQNFMKLAKQPFCFQGKNQIDRSF